MPMPCACACWNTEFSARTSPFEASLSGMPQLLETTFARCLSTTSFRAWSSPFDVVRRPHVEDVGAWGDRVRPLHVQRLLDVPLLRVGGVTRVLGGARRDHLASSGRVGRRNVPREAVEVGTDRGREERPGDRDRAGRGRPGAAAAAGRFRRPTRSAGGVYPQISHGSGVPGANGLGKRSAGVLAPVVRARADRGAGGRRRCRRVDVRPRQRVGVVEPGDRRHVRGQVVRDPGVGIRGAHQPAHSRWYIDSFTRNACSTWATVPPAVTNRWFWGTATRSNPCARSQSDTLATELESGANRERNCCGDSQR